jgi:4-hydroxy-tetrahydrodipicolinate reductase
MIRVVQWATGTIGTRALRTVIEHPAMELAGVHVTAADKAGRDAGDLCGLGPTGITATTDPKDILDLGADCILYMPRQSDGDELCMLLASGANVVTTCGAFHHPASMDPLLRARVEQACTQGVASLHATGSSPGFITEALPLTLASLQRRIDRLAITEFGDLSQRPSPELLFTHMGFGHPLTGPDERRVAHLRDSFGPSLRLLADALHHPLDRVADAGEIATARRTTRIAAGVIEAGTVAAQRTTVTGLRAGRPWLSFTATWYCTTDIEPSWDLRPTGWHLALDGDAPLDIDLRFPVPLDRMAATSPGYTAHRAVNAVPAVVAAVPGIHTTLDLPHLISALA